MTFVTAHRTEISIADLHTLSNDDFTNIVIEVRRRAEPGAGQFTGVQFLSSNEKIARFETTTDALTFIDQLHRGGIPEAIRHELLKNPDTDTVTPHDIVTELQFYNENTDPDAYLDRTGLQDPMNLQIIPQKETTETVSTNENPTTNTTASTDMEV